MATVHDAPKHVGPFDTKEEAQREADRLNEQRGGPGFHVERRDPEIGDKYVEGPYAYVAEETSPGRWSATLQLWPDLR